MKGGDPKEEHKNEITLIPISRKRNHIEGDGVPQISKQPRTAFVSDLVWPIMKINQSEYSKRFNVQILDAMSMVQQAMSQIVA